MFKLIFKILVLLLLFISPDLLSDTEKNKSIDNPTNKSMSISDIWVDANRLNGVFRNNGIWYYDLVGTTQGTEWPNGTGLSPVFAAGQWIGAKVNGEVRVAGVQHSATEYQSGEILSPYVPADPSDPIYRWYYLLPGGGGDWTNWPFAQGAPYKDLNGNGQYDPGETPLLFGDATIFSVWNDLADHAEFGTNKLSVEVRQTAFAYDSINELGDMHFIKWQLVNKSSMDWDSTYFAVWLDPDLGDFSDDLVGCDTVLNLGFCYNASDNDQIYGTAPPAVGVNLLQGPIVDNPDSTVILPNGTILIGKEMTRMTSFVYYDNNPGPSGNPDNGSDVWNYFRAYWRDGTKITYGDRGTNPSNPPTNFMFSGDPETGTGWIDYNADDRRFLMTIGPFSMPSWTDTSGNGLPDFGEPGVQDIIVATMVAQGTDHLNSVTNLKAISALARQLYQSNFIITSISNIFQQPMKFQLYQNYPNPFNPHTTIEFSIPKTEFVTLKIYNLLGQVVATLVSDKLNPGNYQYPWDASDFASGIYYYKIEAGKFMRFKKMILIK